MKTTGCITILKELIALPSYVDDRNNESQVSAYIKKYLSQFCPWFTLVEQSLGSGRNNIIASTGDNPDLVVVCHMDTVQPVGNINDMLAPTMKNGYIYGLGAVDMKAGIAAVLTALSNVKQIKNSAIIFDCDEEYNFRGAKALFKKYFWNPQLVLCPEPTDLKLVNGCKGVIEITVDVVGKTAHAGKPEQGINAIEKALESVLVLRHEILQYRDNELGETTLNLSGLQGGRLVGNTITVQGNAVADIARMVIDIRPASTQLDAQKVCKMWEPYAKSCVITLDYPAYRTHSGELAILEKAIALSGLAVYYQQRSERSGFYEAALFSRMWNCPAVSFGPGPANSAHTKGECVSISDLQSATTVYTKLFRLFG
ncbi:MAG: M20/M25/M40 family metallo-hydrolase [Candidatus Roizmanbacteria bacterium]|nr:M20/M25/M40 family metallo-hydrolase [Candidatus Roizmanbacteria bacterium]